MEDDYLKKNPTNSKHVFISAKKAAKREALGEEHIVQIMAALPRLQETDRLVMALLLFTGLRRSEVQGLRWEDIDWARGMTMERYAHGRVEKVKEAGAQIEAVFKAL